jgi:hypothetical protein
MTMRETENNVHSTRSSHREALLEHLFTGEVMKHLWQRGDCRLEVLKPQVDDSGYDLVLEANAIVRHVQLKSSFRGSKVNETNVNMLLAGKPSGCVVFLWFDQQTLDLGPFAFFGGAPGQPLPDLAGMKIGKHTKANAEGVKAERPNIRTVPLSKFERLGSVEQVVNRLFYTILNYEEASDERLSRRR